MNWHGVKRIRAGLGVCEQGCIKCMAGVAQLKREAALRADPSIAKHGTTTTYTNYACRCDECVAAMGKKNAKRSLTHPTGPWGRRRKIEPFGREWTGA